jgi:hypothetical protein
MYGCQHHPPFKNEILRNKAIFKILNCLSINEKHKTVRILSHKTNPSLANLKATTSCGLRTKRLWTINDGRPPGTKIKVNKTKK